MPETQNIEYKSTWRDEFLREICGFANVQGGTLSESGLQNIVYEDKEQKN